MRPPKWQYWVPIGDDYLKKARWNSENTKLFLDLLAEEVTTSRRGESPVLTTEGYSNVSKKFYERTHIYLKHRQLKNKYHLLKKDWQSLSFLENPKYGVTGLDYDYATGTWNASDEWWDMMIQMRPDVAKWRHKGIPHINEMRAVFQGVIAKSHHVWTPGETKSPFLESMPHGTQIEVNDETGDNEEDVYPLAFDFHGRVDHPNSPTPSAVSVASPRRRSLRLMSRNTTPSIPVPTVAPMTRVAKNLFRPSDTEGSSCGKKRSTPATELSGSISEVVSQLERHVKGAGIPEAMKLLKFLPGVPVGSPLYWKGLRMILDDRKRLVFLILDSDALRLDMVKKIG